MKTTEGVQVLVQKAPRRARDAGTRAELLRHEEEELPDLEEEGGEAKDRFVNERGENYLLNNTPNFRVEEFENLPQPPRYRKKERTF